LFKSHRWPDRTERLGALGRLHLACDVAGDIAGFYGVLIRVPSGTLSPSLLLFGASAVTRGVLLNLRGRVVAAIGRRPVVLADDAEFRRRRTTRDGSESDSRHGRRHGPRT